jgi:hypothetical protein
MILIANCPHNNGIYTYLDRSAGLIIKSSYASGAIKRLEREHTGYEWYLRLMGLEDTARLELKRWRADSYARLLVSHFPGNAGDSYGRLSDNRRGLLAAVELYSRIWPTSPGRLVPIHGDFDLGNIVTGPGGSVIIDWEHFHMDAAPWGLDLLNLLYGATALSLRKRDPLSVSDTRTFYEVRDEIAGMLDPRGDLECSLSTLTEFISSHSSIWGGLVSKLPVMNLTAAQRAYVTGLERVDSTAPEIEGSASS